jgi:hypothetical protein
MLACARVEFSVLMAAKYRHSYFSVFKHPFRGLRVNRHYSLPPL